MGKLEGKVAIVTGGGQGMGFGYCKGFVKEGAKVVIAEFNDETGKKAEEELISMGGEAMFVHCNVGDEQNVIDTVKKTVERFGTVNILVNNAQATEKPYTPIDATTSSAMELAFRTGPLATMIFMRECIPYMRESGYGRIINVCSDTGIDGMETFAAYGSAKEGIRCLTRVGARELGKDQITVNVVSPGALTAAAKMWKEMNPAGFAETMKPVPLARLGDIDSDIVPAVVFLASPDGNYITGQTIFLDGGHTFGR